MLDRRRLILALSFPLITRGLFAAKHVPLPAGAYTAKSIFIDNQTGVQQTVDTVSDDIRKWGRLSTVDARDNADLIATFTKVEVLINGTTLTKVHLSVILHASSDPFYQDEEIARGFHLVNNRLGLSAEKCFERFRKRLEENH